MAVHLDTSIASPFHGHTSHPASGVHHDRYILTRGSLGAAMIGYLRSDLPVVLTNCSITLPTFTVPNSSRAMRPDLGNVEALFPFYDINYARIWGTDSHPYTLAYIGGPGETVPLGTLSLSATQRETWQRRIDAELYSEPVDTFWWAPGVAFPISVFPWFPVTAPWMPRTVEPYEAFNYNNSYLGDGWDEWEQTVQWAFTSDQTGTILSDPLPLTFINARVTPSFPVSSMGSSSRVRSGDTFESVMRLDVSGDHSLQITVTPSYGDSGTTGTLFNLVGDTDEWEFEWGTGGGASFVDPPGSSPDWDESHIVLMPPGSWITWKVSGVAVRPNGVMTGTGLNAQYQPYLPLEMRLTWEVAPITVGGVTQPSGPGMGDLLNGTMSSYMMIGSRVNDFVTDCLIVDDVVMTRERHPL